MGPIREPRDRNSERGVEDRKGQAAQQAHAGIGDVQVAANRLDQQRQDLPVDERAGVRQREHEDHEPSVQRIDPGSLLGQGCRCRLLKRR